MSALIRELNVQNLEEHRALLRDVGPLHQEAGRSLGHFREFTLDSAFQPIFEVESGKLFAHEALLRARNGLGTPVSPEGVFATPVDAHELVFLDRLCRTVHVLNYVAEGSEAPFLFLNLDPLHIRAVAEHGLVFEGILRRSGLTPEQVVIEVLETAADDPESLGRAIENFRSRGFLVAIDDFGRGHANFDRLWNLNPDLIKFDRHLIASAADDPRLGAVLPKLVDVARARGARVLFEGVEREEELELARTSGADLVQGYLLGRPAAHCAPESSIRPQARLDS